MRIKTGIIMLTLALATAIEWNTKGTNYSCITMLVYVSLFIVLNFRKLNKLI